MNYLNLTPVLTSILLCLQLINETSAVVRVKNEDLEKETPVVENELLQANRFDQLIVRGNSERRREINVKYLPNHGLETLMLKFVNLKWDNDEPKYLENIKEIDLDNVELNPNSLIFSDPRQDVFRMQSFRLTNTRFINGSLVDLLRTSTLTTLDLFHMGTLDIPKPAGTTGIKKKTGINDAFPSSLTNLYLINTTLKGEGTTPLSLSGLKFVGLEELEINTNWIRFSDGLQSMRLNSVKVTNGTVYDLVRTATNIKSLDIRNHNSEDKIIDLSKLANSKSLTELHIDDSELISSSSFKFLELKELSISDVVLKTIIFQKLEELFPNIETFNVFAGTTVSPADLLSILKCDSLNYFRVPFDFEPQIKTYEYGEVMKFLSSVGFDTAAKRTDRVHFLRFKRDDRSKKWNVILLKTEVYQQPEKVVKPQDSQIIIYTYFVLLSLLMLTGILSNALSFCVLLRKRFRNSSGFILLGLTICDSLVIITYIASSIFNATIFYNVFFKSGTKQKYLEVAEYVWISEQDDVQAFLIYPLNKTGYTGSVYMTVLISLERFVAVCWPLKAKLLLSPKKSKIAIAAIWIFSFLLNFPRWIESYEWNYYSESSQHWNDYYRPTLMRMEMYRSIYHGWIWVIAMYILPFIVVGFFNYKILRQVKLSKQVRRSMQSGGSELSNNEQAEEAEIKSLTKMLLCVVSVFVLCNSIHIVIVFYFILAYDNIQLSTIEAVSCLPLIVNSSVNFLIYIVLGKTLRVEFLKLVSSCFWCFKS